MPQTYFTTSWDDGHPADLRVAAMLTRHGLGGTFYTPRSIESGAMSASQVREIAEQGFEVGAHTLNHVFLPTASESVARDEITGSKKWVEDVTGRPCRMFCPPGGKFDVGHLDLIRAAGFLGVRTVELVSLDFPRERGGVMEMPTTIQAFPHAMRAYARNFARRAAARNLWTYLVHGHTRDWTTLAARLVDRAAVAGGVFHLWGHSWELEQTRQWERLDDVLGLMSRYVGGLARSASNGTICQLARGDRESRPRRAA